MKTRFFRGAFIGLALFLGGVLLGGAGHGPVLPLLFVIGPMSLLRWLADVSPTAHNQFAWITMLVTFLLYGLQAGYGTEYDRSGQLNAAKIPIPEALTFAPVDFENQSLADQLQKVGFRTDEPSFFSWLGVTMYLTRETMMATMEYTSSSTPSGSGIVFDYVVPLSSQNVLRRLVFRLLARRLARVGEPWVCFFDPDLLIMDLKTIGFTQVEDIGPDEINARYFKDRADKLMVGNFGHLMKAQL